MPGSQIEIAVENYVAVVTMNNPPVNAKGGQFLNDMMSTMDEISDRDDIRVAVLTGARKCFSAGTVWKPRLSERPPPSPVKNGNITGTLANVSAPSWSAESRLSAR